jgi:hypothetical protein
MVDAVGGRQTIQVSVKNKGRKTWGNLFACNINPSKPAARHSIALEAVSNNLLAKPLHPQLPLSYPIWVHHGVHKFPHLLGQVRGISEALERRLQGEVRSVTTAAVCAAHAYNTQGARSTPCTMATQWQLFSHEEKLCTHSRPCRVDLAAVVHLARMIDEPVHEHCVCHAATHTFSTIEPARKPVAATDTYMAASCSFLPWSWRPTRVEAP